MKIAKEVFRLLSVLSLTAFGLFAQAPTGAISGTVTDASGAVIPNAKVTVLDKGTGSERVLNTTVDGLFSAPSLPAGDYEVRAEADGFRATVRQATVQTGSTTTVNLGLTIGGAGDVVTV